MTRSTQEEFSLCARELEKESVKERLLEIGKEIERMEKVGNNDIVVVSLLNDFRTLSEKLKVLS